MGVKVPTLESTLWLTSVPSIIMYQIRKYMTVPGNTVPIPGGVIKSLRQAVADFSTVPSDLASKIRTDLAEVLGNIFQESNNINVVVSASDMTSDGYDINIAVYYTDTTGSMVPIGTGIHITKDGEIVIPEDSVAV